MAFEAFAGRWWAAARSRRSLAWFAWFNRIALFLAFLPSGITKVLGRRFTTLSPESSVGYFFDALYKTGVYWRFIGVAQLLAGVLLLIPRTQALGAVLYFPLILNIFLITVSMRFQGTPFITGAMLLANIYLLCWHYDAWRGLIAGRNGRSS